MVRREDGSLVGIEAVIDKDMASSLLAIALKADKCLMLTDVDAVYKHWAKPEARPIDRISTSDMHDYDFASGSMQPKVNAACEFVEQTGGSAGIGALQDVSAILSGKAGTLIMKD